MSRWFVLPLSLLARLAVSVSWIDGYWSWGGHRHDWVPGYCCHRLVTWHF